MADTSRGSRAAQLAAGQVEAIVAAAQLAAEKIRIGADTEATDRRVQVEKEVERIVSEGLAEAEEARADATREAEKLRADAAQEADKARTEAAEEAARLRSEAKSETDALRSRTAKATAAERKAAADEARLARDTAKAEVDEMLTTARQEADRLVEEARQQATEVGSQARAEAQERVASARQAADEALADARAISDGLHKLGDLLTGHSERILRDVTNAHRGIAAHLRVAASNASASPGREPRERERSPDRAAEPANGNREAASERPRQRTRRGSEADFEPPTWLDNG
jgi:vacuolar-type H+-ATPase subunit E/Vma4